MFPALVPGPASRAAGAPGLGRPRRPPAQAQSSRPKLPVHHEQASREARALEKALGGPVARQCEGVYPGTTLLQAPINQRPCHGPTGTLTARRGLHVQLFDRPEPLPSGEGQEPARTVADHAIAADSANNHELSRVSHVLAKAHGARRRPPRRPGQHMPASLCLQLAPRQFPELGQAPAVVRAGRPGDHHGGFS